MARVGQPEGRPREQPGPQEEQPGDRPGQPVPLAELRPVEQPVLPVPVEGLRLADQLELLVHRVPSSNKLGCSNSRSECCRPNSQHYRLPCR